MDIFESLKEPDTKQSLNRLLKGFCIICMNFDCTCFKEVTIKPSKEISAYLIHYYPKTHERCHCEIIMKNSLAGSFSLSKYVLYNNLNES